MSTDRKVLVVGNDIISSGLLKALARTAVNLFGPKPKPVQEVTAHDLERMAKAAEKRRRRMQKARQ